MAHSSWGPGWPNCQGSKINKSFFVQTQWGAVTFPGGVRFELCELVECLVKETSLRGYRFGVESNPSYGCWGYACRAISGTNKPSNHSWGLAIDINAPSNPMKKPLTTNMPSWMVDLWKSYGFTWGGNYSGTPDAMHYEFLGSVSDCSSQTQKARQNGLGLGSVPVEGVCNVVSVMPVLRQGSTGLQVNFLQSSLNVKSGPNLNVDGNFGPKTLEAVNNWQRIYNLAVDGVVGENTWRTLFEHPKI